MSFRTLEITNPTEIHIKNNQLELTQENRQIYIPIEDLSMITTIGANIRLSTMDLSILANNHVSLTTLDNKYSPTALVFLLP
jgi:CRISPR/Cas system-associated endonuclease Cas1